MTSVRPELLADAVDKQFDAAASLAYIDVEVFAVGEQFADLAEHSPSCSLVKAFRSDILELGIAARAGHGVHGYEHIAQSPRRVGELSQCPGEEVADSQFRRPAVQVVEVESARLNLDNTLNVRPLTFRGLATLPKPR